MDDVFGQRSPKTNGYLNNIPVYDDNSIAVEDDPLTQFLNSPTVVPTVLPADSPDAQRDFHTPGGFNNQALRLSHEATIADQDAMNYLRQALNNSNEITPTQGIAAALLAAIPTLGGYMIGKSVGNPDLPEGVYGLKPTYDSAAAGGLMGSQIGLGSSGEYLKSLDRTDKENEILQKMAAVEAQKASSLRNDEQQTNISGLGVQARRDELPAETAARIEIEKARRQDRSPSMIDFYSPAQIKAKIAKETGVDAEGNPVKKEDNFDIPATLKRELAIDSSLIKLGDSLVPEIRKMTSWSDYQKTGLGSQFDTPEALQARMRNLADLLGRLRSGAVLNPGEKKYYDSWVSGDITADPQTAANLLSKLLDDQRLVSRSKVEALTKFTDPESALSVFDKPSSSPTGMPSVGSTFNGKKVLSVTRIK